MGLFSRFKKEEIFYYPGCRTHIKHKDLEDFYLRVFYRLGINIALLDKHLCCGMLPLELGYEQEARKIARKNLEFLKENNVKKIITNCPSCYKMMSRDYSLMLPDWDIEIVDMWKLILEMLEKKPRLIKKKANDRVTFNDSCYLGRHCGVYEEPRKILELLGYEVVEMYDSKERSICAGNCGGIGVTNPEEAEKIAFQKILQAKRTRTKKMIVTSLLDYDILKDNSEGIEILELSEVLIDALGIKTDSEEGKINDEGLLQNSDDEVSDVEKENLKED
jgi:Fe-S oxidoreductase